MGSNRGFYNDGVETGRTGKTLEHRFQGMVEVRSSLLRSSLPTTFNKAWMIARLMVLRDIKLSEIKISPIKAIERDDWKSYESLPYIYIAWTEDERERYIIIPSLGKYTTGAATFTNEERSFFQDLVKEDPFVYIVVSESIVEVDQNIS